MVFNFSASPLHVPAFPDLFLGKAGTSGNYVSFTVSYFSRSGRSLFSTLIIHEIFVWPTFEAYIHKSFSSVVLDCSLFHKYNIQWSYDMSAWRRDDDPEVEMCLNCIHFIQLINPTKFYINALNLKKQFFSQLPKTYFA